MGIAWLDGEPAAMEAVELRSGGLPLLPEDTAWPYCPRCEGPLLFRAQIPLATTSLVDPLDDRSLLLFECHAQPESAPCPGTEALVVRGACTPRQPPLPGAWDVVLDDAGPEPERLAEMLARIDAGPPPRLAPRATIAHAIPASLAEQTLRLLTATGARITLRESPPTTLPAMHGALLVPFDDGAPGSARTTLPPLAGLTRTSGPRLRGFLGGATAGYRDHAFACACGQPTRTVARLLAVSEDGLALGAAVAQFCVACGRASHTRAAGG
jgi:hypothetical protein